MDEYTFSIHPELAGKKIDMRVLRRNAIGEIRDVWKGVLHRLRIVGIIPGHRRNRRIWERLSEWKV